MSDLQRRLEKLMLRLDYMGMRVEQAYMDALNAIRKTDVEAGMRVHENDSAIDIEEVEIEQECIRLLALYQPAAIDLRKICTIIKANSDLERIADFAAGMGKRVKHLRASNIDLSGNAMFLRLADCVTNALGKTVRMLSVTDTDTAQSVISDDDETDMAHRNFVRSVLDPGSSLPRDAEAVMTLINIAKALERIGDLCTNIAEDIIFLRTGDIVRHGGTSHT